MVEPLPCGMRSHLVLPCSCAPRGCLASSCSVLLSIWDSSLWMFGHLSWVGAVVHPRRPGKGTEETRTAGHITVHSYYVLYVCVAQAINWPSICC